MWVINQAWSGPGKKPSFPFLLQQLSTLRHPPFIPLHSAAQSFTTMTDSVMAESSLFWKLVIEPTQFPWFFCEPVARIFESESESEPYSRDGYLWRCCFKETMINGRVTIDINVVRVHIKGSAQWQDVLRRTSNKEDILPFGSTAQQVPIKSTQHPENLQHQRSSVGDANQRDQEWPPKIHYKTVAFYTPQKNAPITSIFLNGDTIAGEGSTIMLF